MAALFCIRLNYCSLGLLKAILPLLPLDTYEKDRFILMEVVPGDPVVPVIWDEYKEILNEQEPGTPVEFMERFAYYERAKNAYCVVATGETAQYANIILKKGVVYTDQTKKSC